MKTFTYTLKNLTCAHCAAKIEEKIQQLPEVEKVTYTFATQKLRVDPAIEFSGNDTTLGQIVQTICDTIEDGVVVESLTLDKNNSEEEHHHHHHHDHQGVWAVAELVTGLAILIGAGVLNLVSDPYRTVLLVGAFIFVGRDVLWTALRNTAKGQVFDENFLMAIATVGAVAIKEYPEALGVMLFYRVGLIFEERATEKSRKAIMEVVDMRPETVTLVSESGSLRTIGAEQARVGDIAVVRAGDRIPLDGTVVDGESRIDTSPITGEPVPVMARIGTAITSGCVNISGTLKVKIEKTLDESMVTKILNAVENAAADKPKIDRFITRFSRYYTPAVVAIAVATAVIPSLVTGNWEYWIYTALTFLVISCPCALVLSVPLSFFAGIGAGSKRGILFKGGRVIEALKQVRVIAMDKTGTVTEGNFKVQEVESVGIAEMELLRLCAGAERLSSHPIATSIWEEGNARQLNIPIAEAGEEIAGEGLIATVEGMKILCGNRRLMNRHSIDIPETLRKVAGVSEILVAIDGQFRGRILIADTIKADAVEAVRKLSKNGYTVAMLTGDGEENARVVAGEANIPLVFAGLLPQEKLETLNTLRKEYGSVMFVGDGINDAPVLAGANVGAAMGSGADAAIEAADVVFMNGEVNSVPASLHVAKNTLAIAWQNVVIALGIKAVIMILGFFGHASMWAAVFADTGVMAICVMNSIRILYKK